MKKLERSLALLLALLLPALNGCGSNGSGIDNGADSSDGNSTAVDNSQLFGGTDFSGIDLGNRSFRFAVRGDSFNEFACVDLWADSTTGDLLNDAIFARNTAVCEKFSFEIEEIRMSEYPSEAVRKSVMASSDDYDVVYDNLQRLADLSADSYLLDLLKVDGFDFTKQYWDEGINDQLTLKGKLYYTTGEHMLSVKNGLYGVFFNKDMLEDYRLEDPYQLVADGKWTIEKMHQMASGTSEDLDGNGKLDYNDQWGVVTETYNAYTFLIGSGNVICAKDKDDLPYLALNTESAVKALELASELLTDENTTILVDSHTSDLWDTVWSVFDTGRALFCEGALMNTPKLRNYDLTFGILPSPKLDEAQKDYYHTISVWNASLMSIPATVTDSGEVGQMLEILAAASYDTLRPAYYELQLKNKLIRDTDSEAMLDIIFSTITFDLGAVYDFGGLFWGVMNIGNGKSSFASKYSSCETSAKAAIDKLIEQINASE